MFIKGFDKNLKCCGFQFEVGKAYDTGYTDNLKLCSETVFHFCRNMQQVHRYYDVTADNRYCEVEVLGELIEDDEKCGSNRIRIIREIAGVELEQLKGHSGGNTGLFNTGNCNTGNCNTGNCNTGSWNTGYRNTGNWNTGNRNTGNCNTGSWNTGNCNTGNCNTGNCNTGSWNTGNCNTGNCNTGKCNTGNWNTGSWNTGSWNAGFYNTKERTVSIFNKESGMTYEECCMTGWYYALYSVPFNLTEWIAYSEEEKENSVIRRCIGGYLQEYTFEEACVNWWMKMSEDNKALIQTMPNFDKDILKEITGIDVDVEERQ